MVVAKLTVVLAAAVLVANCVYCDEQKNMGTVIGIDLGTTYSW